MYITAGVRASSTVAFLNDVGDRPGHTGYIAVLEDVPSYSRHGRPPDGIRHHLEKSLSEFIMGPPAMMTGMIAP